MTVAFSWNGLPQYAARLIRAAIDALGEPCVVVGSRPEVPVTGMEEVLGQSAHWVDAGRPVSWSELGLAPPSVFVQSGWAYPAFNALGTETHRAGGRVIGMMDNNWRGDFRQRLLAPIGFRLLHRRKFDRMLVAGKSGRRLARYFGMPNGAIRTGMYGADPSIFFCRTALAERRREFLFVGQFLARKDVMGLCEAFLAAGDQLQDWTLRLCGSGELRNAIPRHPRIHVDDFVQPEALHARFDTARVFVLPSLFEAWGLVVHEAALSGCAMILSDAIGSAPDLASPQNALSYPAGDRDALRRRMLEAAEWSSGRLEEASTESVRLARAFGPATFASQIKLFVEELRPGG